MTDFNKAREKLSLILHKVPSNGNQNQKLMKKLLIIRLWHSASGTQSIWYIIHIWSVEWQHFKSFSFCLESYKFFRFSIDLKMHIFFRLTAYNCSLNSNAVKNLWFFFPLLELFYFVWKNVCLYQVFVSLNSIELFMKRLQRSQQYSTIRLFNGNITFP